MTGAIFVGAGHSNTDPGAVANGRKESDIAIDMRNMVAFYLRRENVKTVTDGEGLISWPLTKSAGEARKHPVAVEFHCNAAVSPAATGVETLSAIKDFDLGLELCLAISHKLGIRSRGAKAENSGQHRRLAFVQAGGIIVELFFITNPDDLRAYDERKWLAARAVADVLRAALKERA